MIYFAPREFGCRCGCGLGGLPASRELRAYLDALRLVHGRPILVTSGWRCARHNGEVGGRKASDHLRGAAADITSAKADDFAALARVHAALWRLVPPVRRAWSQISDDRRYIHISLEGDEPK